MIEITTWDQMYAMGTDPLPEGTAVEFGGEVLADIIAGKEPPRGWPEGMGPRM